jgi:hypothetical protein
MRNKGCGRETGDCKTNSKQNAVPTKLYKNILKYKTKLITFLNTTIEHDRPRANTPLTLSGSNNLQFLCRTLYICLQYGDQLHYVNYIGYYRANNLKYSAIQISDGYSCDDIFINLYLLVLLRERLRFRNK